jgi:hypothetical protein
MVTETYDASFYEMVHQLIEPDEDQADAERRGRQRRSFPRVQFIAPLVDGRMPQESTFREVQCHDLSARGFSYLTPRPPECTHLVVGLGTPPTLLYLTAEVKHYSTVLHGDQSVYLVGCLFTGRMGI